MKDLKIDNQEIEIKKNVKIKTSFYIEENTDKILDKIKNITGVTRSEAINQIVQKSNIKGVDNE
jgi:hypothetical protein